MKKEKIFMKSAGTRGYSPLARVMTLAVMLLAMAATAWAANTVTWTTTQLGTLAGKTTATIDGVTITTTSAITESGGRATFNGATFSVEDGNITKIVLKSISGVSSYPAGWTISNNTEATWTGSAKSVSCGYSGGVYNIEFTIETVYTVTMAEGTVDKDNWTISPTEAAEGKPITATYSGTKHVKSVKALKKASAVKVTAITLNKTATTITKISGTATETLSVTAVTPDDATDQTVTWSSDNEAVATVDASTGVVTAVATGTAHIRATANDGSGVYGECTVTVSDLSAYYSNMTSCGSNSDDQISTLKSLGRGYQAYNSSLTAAQAWELAKYRATVDGMTTYVVMSSQNSGYEIHYAVSTDVAATEHVSDLYDLIDYGSSTILNMYYVAQ